MNRATALEVNEQVKIDVVDENVKAKRHTAAKFLDGKGRNEEVEKGLFALLNCVIGCSESRSNMLCYLRLRSF